MAEFLSKPPPVNVIKEELDIVGDNSGVPRDKSVPLLGEVSDEDVVTETSVTVPAEPSRYDFEREHNDNIENILKVVNQMDDEMDILLKQSQEDLYESSVCTFFLILKSCTMKI